MEKKSDLEIVIDMQRRLDEYHRFECNLVTILNYFGNSNKLSIPIVDTPHSKSIYALICDLEKKFAPDMNVDAKI